MGSVSLQNSDQLESGKGSNSSSSLNSNSKAGIPEEEGKQEDGDSHSRSNDEGDEAGKPIRLEPEVEIGPGGAQGGYRILPSEATPTPASTLAIIPNPRKSGSSERSTTSSNSGSQNRKGRTGGLAGSPRATYEIDPSSSSIKDKAEEMDEDAIKEQKTNKDEKGGQGREKERSTVVVGKRDRKRSTDTSSSSSSIKTGSGSGSGFTRDVVEDENKVSNLYRYIGLKSQGSHSYQSTCSSYFDHYV